MGAIDFGRLYFGWVNLQNTARIGANFAALHPDAWGASGSTTYQAAYAQQMQNDAAAINCVLPSPLPTPTFPDGNVLGGRAQVSLTCGFRLLTPIMSSIVGTGGVVQLGSTAVFPIRTGLVSTVPAPTPTPTPTPAPTPTPPSCTVPAMIGEHVTKAQNDWATAGFSPGNLLVTLGPRNYTILSETPSGFEGTTQDCAAFSLRVNPT